MRLDSLGLMSIWPVDDDVLRVALLEFVPLLVREDVEIQIVERRDVLIDARLAALTSLCLPRERQDAGKNECDDEY